MTPTCYLHPFRDATATCVECRRSICDECRETISGRPVCRPCVEAIRSRVASELDTEPISSPTTQPTPTSPPPAESEATLPSPAITTVAMPSPTVSTATGDASLSDATKPAITPRPYVPKRASNPSATSDASAGDALSPAAFPPPTGNFDFSTAAPLSSPSSSFDAGIPTATPYGTVAVAPIRPANYLLGALLGIVGGLIGALVWDKIAIVTHLKIGYIAWGVGALVGIGITLGARGTNKITGVMAAILTFGAIMLGQYWIMLDELKGIYPDLLLPLLPTSHLIGFVAKHTTPMSWVLTAIGVFISYGIASAPNVQPVKTPAARPGGPMQS